MVGETQKRGAVERAYALREGAAHLDGEAVRAARLVFAGVIVVEVDELARAERLHGVGAVRFRKGQNITIPGGYR